MSQLRFTPIVRDLPATVPFVGPEAQERVSGVKFRARLGANESAFGASPSAIEAASQAIAENWKYGDPENHDLREALADHYGVSMDNIMIGEGIDGLFGYLARLFVTPGVNVVSSLGSYPTFNFHIKGNGGNIDLLPFVNDHEDPETLLARARETDAALLYFSNPNNPMGTWYDAAAMADLVDRVPERTVLVLDEAYIEFAPEGTAPPIDVSRPNLLRFRTFSKAYGMAGARVGYVIGHRDLVSAFDKIRNHYGMNRVGQIAARAALGDQAWLETVRGKVARGRDRIAEIALQNGLTPIPSATNFVTIDCGRGPDYAKTVMAEFLKRGIFIRMPGVEPQSRCVRVSVGLDEELDLLAHELPGILEAVS